MLQASALSLSLDITRVAVGRKLDPATRSAFGQFMTSSSVARFMASLYSPNAQPIRLMDAGAGIGALSVAFVDRFGVDAVAIDAWEIDQYLESHLSESLKGYTAQIHASDFIQDAVWNLMMQTGTRFTHAILNPPYKKLNSDSKHRLQLRKVGVEAVNLYAAFVALAILLVEEEGEIVAIIPRSFCNGVYYLPFRKMLLSRCSIEHIHVFESRRNVFKEDGVLQENVIMKLGVGRRQGDVAISDSEDSTFQDYHERRFPFDQIVKQDDSQHYIHIPLHGATHVAHELTHSLRDLGIEVSTGPVVDFRVRDYCVSDLTKDSVPLIYPQHFSQGFITFPNRTRNPNALIVNDETRKMLMPAGYYVLVKRLTSKEEKHRVVAYVLDPNTIDAQSYAFENHLNVFHIGKRGLDRETAYGLQVFLNSTEVDEAFRSFSGHTQVNAADLRQLRYPSREQLRRMGVLSAGQRLGQNEIDQIAQQR